MQPQQPIHAKLNADIVRCAVNTSDNSEYLTLVCIYIAYFALFVNIMSSIIDFSSLRRKKYFYRPLLHETIDVLALNPKAHPLKLYAPL